MTDDDEFASEESHKVAMAARSIINAVADLNEIDPAKIDPIDAYVLLLANSILGRILMASINRKAA